MLKQAKWSVSGDLQKDAEKVEDREADKDRVDTFNKPELQEEKREEKREEKQDDVDNALQNALKNLRDENEFDLSKRTHILIVSEKRKHFHKSDLKTF